MNAITKLWKSLTFLADAAQSLGDTLLQVNSGLRVKVGLDQLDAPEPEAVEATNSNNGKKRVTVK